MLSGYRIISEYDQDKWVAWNIPCVDQAKGNGVGANTERTPFFADGLGEADDSSFGGSVVGLANVSVKTGCRRHVNDGTVLSLLGL